MGIFLITLNDTLFFTYILLLFKIREFDFTFSICLNNSTINSIMKGD